MNSRAKAHQAYVPTDIEHFANVVTHAVSNIVVIFRNKTVSLILWAH